MGSKLFRLQVFAIGLIGLVVLSSNFGGFQALIKRESNELSPESLPVQVARKETSSERLARPAMNSSARVVSPSNGYRGISNRAAADEAKDNATRSWEAHRSKVESNGQLASKRKGFDENAIMFEDYEDRKFDNQTETYLSSHTKRNSSVNPIPAVKDLLSINHPHYNVTGDISFLLDFAIIAHPKTATTFLGDYLNRSEGIYIHSEEHCFMKSQKVTEFVTTHLPLYKQWRKEGKDVKIGIKCPGVFYRDIDMDNLDRYFPNTKLIVGLRHPISWFESFYNYRVLQGNFSMPTTSELARNGRCFKSTAISTLCKKKWAVCKDRRIRHKVCPESVKYHVGLSHLRGTPMGYNNYSVPSVRRPSLQQNDVFLYDMKQIQDDSDSFRAALERHLGLALPESEDLTTRVNEHSSNRAIHICDAEHELIRRTLTGIGATAADWILSDFLDKRGVSVASPSSFKELILDWRIDHCNATEAE